MVRRQAEDLGFEEFERSRMDHTEPIDGQRERMMDRPHAIGSTVPDWADFAVEPRPRRTADGFVQLVVERKWSNSSGQWFLTRFLDAHPNGTLPGKWVAEMPGGIAGNRIDMKAHGTPRPQ
jgi:hypothetical protein